MLARELTKAANREIAAKALETLAAQVGASFEREDDGLNTREITCYLRSAKGPYVMINLDGSYKHDAWLGHWVSRNGDFRVSFQHPGNDWPRPHHKATLFTFGSLTTFCSCLREGFEEIADGSAFAVSQP
jgi:hypothetical protein